MNIPSRTLKAVFAGLLSVSLVLTATHAAAQGTAPPSQEPGQEQPFAIPGLDATIRFDEIESSVDGSTITFSGYVDIDGRPDWRLQADHVVVTAPADPDAPDADYYFVATGNVTLESGEVLLKGTRMTGNLLAGTGDVENAFGVGPGDVYFRGETISQREPGVYHIRHGVVTPCTQSLPIWEFTARTFDLYANDHVTMMLPVFKVKGVPLIALPALYWPIDEDHRSTGLLIPSVGQSTRKGFMYSQPVFWAISRSADATLSYDYYSKAGNGFSSQFRHAFSTTSNGSARFFWLQGSSFTDEEIAGGAIPIVGGWTLDGEHIHDLPRGWRINASASFFSSREFVQGFEDNFNQFLRRNSAAGLFLTRSWSSYSFNLVADHDETFFGINDSVVRRRLPEVEFRVRRRPLAEPLYFQFEGSYAGLQREERSTGADPLGGRYQRLDAFPEVSLQFNQIPWLTFTPFLNWRSTWYSHRSIDDEFEREAIVRNLYETGVEVIGPSLFRIFDTPTSDYSPRYKHVLEPRFVWGRFDQLDLEEFPRREVIQFDEIDRFGGQRHFARASLINRFLAKRFNTPTDDQRTVWEVFTVELARDFDLREKDPDQVFPTIPLPWSISARVTPTPVINFSGSIRFTPEWTPGGFTLTGGARSSNGNAYVTWFRNAQTFPDPDDPSLVAVESRDRLTGSGVYDIVGRLFTLRGNLTWDVTNRLLQAYAVGATWNTQCCSVGGQFRQTNFSFRDELQFSIIVELLNVGSLGFGSER